MESVVEDFFSYDDFSVRTYFKTKADQFTDRGRENTVFTEDFFIKIGRESKTWLAEWEIISEHFDVMDWWETVGRRDFPLIYPIACLILSLPDSNAGIERVFSGGTWMDGRLLGRQGDATYQMRVLLYKNHDFIKQNRRDLSDDTRLKAAKLRTRELVSTSIGVTFEGSNNELQNTVSAVQADENGDEMVALWNVLDDELTPPPPAKKQVPRTTDQ